MEMSHQEVFTDLVNQLSTSINLKTLPFHKQQSFQVILESKINGDNYYLVRCEPKINQEIHLSPREEDIAKLVAAGLSNKSISQQLKISPWTVATHLRRVFTKLNVTSRAAMIAKLSQCNIWDFT